VRRRGYLGSRAALLRCRGDVASDHSPVLVRHRRRLSRGLHLLRGGRCRLLQRTVVRAEIGRRRCNVGRRLRLDAGHDLRPRLLRCDPLPVLDVAEVRHGQHAVSHLRRLHHNGRGLALAHVSQLHRRLQWGSLLGRRRRRRSIPRPLVAVVRLRRDLDRDRRSADRHVAGGLLRYEVHSRRLRPGHVPERRPRQHLRAVIIARQRTMAARLPHRSAVLPGRTGGLSIRFGRGADRHGSPVVRFAGAGAPAGDPLWSVHADRGQGIRRDRRAPRTLHARATRSRTRRRRARCHDSVVERNGHRTTRRRLRHGVPMRWGCT
jgi:hypothetical protein